MTAVRLRPARIALCAVCAAAALYAQAGAAPQAARASGNQIVFFDATSELLDPATRSATLTVLQALGVSALRLDLSWRDAAPEGESATRPAFEASNPADYNWGEYGAVVAQAQMLGWPVLLTVSAPVPRWATPSHSNAPVRPNVGDFRGFMTALGREFGSEVSFYGIWNEPNQLASLQPQFNRNGTPASPAIYRGLYEAANAGLRAAGLARPPLLLGETAPFGSSHVDARREGLRHSVAPLAFLRGVLCLDSRYRRVGRCRSLPAAGWGHHAYTTAAGPLYVPRDRDVVPIGALGRLVAALNRAASAGALPRGLPIYLTEFGVLTKPNPLGVSPARQAQSDALAEYLAWSNPRVASFAQYLLRDDPSRPHRIEGFQSGLETATGQAKPLFAAWPIPLVVRRLRGGYELWGRVRPAAGQTSLSVLVRSRAGQRFRLLREVTTGARGYWTLQSRVAGVAWRVRWTSAAGATYEGPPIAAS